MPGPLLLALVALAAPPGGGSRHPQPPPTCESFGGRSLSHDMLEATQVEASPEPHALPDLEMAVTPSTLKLAPGESFTVLATIRNRGTKPIDLIFELSSGTGSLVHGFPVRVVPIKSRQNGSGPVPEGNAVTKRVELELAPGAVYCANAKGTATEGPKNTPLAPGKYALEVRTGLASTLATPRATLEVVRN